MTQNYTDFITLIGNEEISKTLFYKSLVLYRKELLIDINDNGQIKVAKKLGMNQTKLSSIVQVLRVLDDNQLLGITHEY